MSFSIYQVRIPQQKTISLASFIQQIKDLSTAGIKIVCRMFQNILNYIFNFLGRFSGL